MAEQNSSNKPLQVSTATFLSADAATAIDGSNKPFIVLSLERNEGSIEQIAISHDDSQMLLGEVLQALKTQGSAVARLMLNVLEQAYEDGSQETGPEDSSGDSADPTGESLGS